MSMLDGVNQCWVLSKDCVVWWDAWGVVVAWIGVAVAIAAGFVAAASVLVTTASAIAVWRLGTEANNLARAPAIALAKEREDQAFVLLAALNGELSRISVEATAWHQSVEQFGLDRMIGSPESLKNASNQLACIAMPVTRSLMGSLHVLPSIQSVDIARCLGISSLVDEYKEVMIVAGENGDFGRRALDGVVADVRILAALATKVADAADRAVRAHVARAN